MVEFAYMNIAYYYYYILWLGCMVYQPAKPKYYH